MSAHAPENHHGDAHAGGGSHATKGGYVAGFLLSALLTAIPFWLVMSGVLNSAQATAIAVVAFAFVQILVHTYFFLHVSRKGEGGWTLMALIFTVVIVTIVISGSLWIMYHLNGNMMPMSGDMPGM